MYVQASIGSELLKTSIAVSPINKNLLLNTLHNACKPVILAYDRDSNTHLPIQNSGKSSHWACLRGYVRYKPLKSERIIQKNMMKKVAIRVQSIESGGDGGGLEGIKQTIENKNKDKSDDVENEDGDDEEVVILLLSHGMSSNPVICSMTELLTSNSQLTSLPSNKHWVVPEQGPRLSKLCLIVKS
jgi:hypothetical protein